MGPIAVVALGGHAILPKSEQPSIGKQFHHARLAMRRILRLANPGSGLVITHGNGPQVGHILIRSEAAADRAYPIPLSVAVAESEGEIGYVIQQSLYNEMAGSDLYRPIVTILTQVLVDRDDPAFDSPTKPVGPYHNNEEAESLRNRGITLQQFPGYGWRRVVPSPRPVKIIEGPTVRRLAEEDVIVIAAGGGGIPVYRENGRLHGVDAVIDKDLASAVLAQGVGAATLFLLTDVPQAYLNYGTPDQRGLASLTVSQAQEYLARGHFPPGSMGPKVEAALQFVRASGGRALITTPEALHDALDGKDGTWINL